MLVVRNNDEPGMIGRVGMALGNAGISIDSMAVGPDKNAHSALMVLSTNTPTPTTVVDEIGASSGILGIHVIALR
jgi:D-3-phosphoglycerate dehydrogenase